MRKIDYPEFKRRFDRLLGPKHINLRKDRSGKWVVYNELTNVVIRTYDSLKTIAEQYELLNQWETL